MPQLIGRISSTDAYNQVTLELTGGQGKPYHVLLHEESTIWKESISIGFRTLIQNTDRLPDMPDLEKIGRRVNEFGDRGEGTFH